MYACLFLCFFFSLPQCDTLFTLSFLPLSARLFFSRFLRCPKLGRTDCCNDTITNSSCLNAMHCCAFISFRYWTGWKRSKVSQGGIHANYHSVQPRRSLWLWRWWLINARRQRERKTILFAPWRKELSVLPVTYVFEYQSVCQKKYICERKDKKRKKKREVYLMWCVLSCILVFVCVQFFCCCCRRLSSTLWFLSMVQQQSSFFFLSFFF